MSSSSSSTGSLDERAYADDQMSMMSSSFDPSDPLSFLLSHVSHTDSSTEDTSSSSQGESPPADWSMFSNMWPTQEGIEEQGQAKFDPAMDFDFSLPMDMDFNGSMAVQPSDLHFDNKLFVEAALAAPTNPAMYSPESLALQYPMYADMAITASQAAQHLQSGPRRLSITSSSSSSGASLSPVMDHAVTAESSSGANFEHPIDPAHELAQRVRLAAGVTLAVPVQGQAQHIPHSTEVQKLPIPRLARPTPPPSSPVKRSSPKPSPSPPILQDISVPSSAVSSPPGSDTTGSSPVSTPSATAPAPTTTVIGRPKTSHTTIERRYRTNLNARIQSLKNAVPALRVLDQKKEDGDVRDDVDDRGFADGVKVARKISKANVLGKATEYIRVLKRREARLKREQDGLRSLVSGLIGGPALLREWEREWAQRFGGAERDEVENDGSTTDDEGDDGESEDGGDEEEAGRARKKPKVSKPAPKKERSSKPTPSASASTATASGVVPEKRKRGRPRKVPIQPISPVDTSMAGLAVPMDVGTTEQRMMQNFAPAQAQAPAPQQYLLAAFAFFSFFNSPLTSSPPSYAHHGHSGSVLTSPSSYAATSVSRYAFGWQGLIQAFHLLVSALVFISIVFPLLPKKLRVGRLLSLTPLTSALRAGDLPTPPPSPTSETPSLSSRKNDTFNRVALIDALSPSCRGRPDEAEQLRAALGVYPGVVGLVQGILKGWKRSGRGIERMQLEQRAWVRLGELVALNDSLRFSTRLSAYWGMISHTSSFSASTIDLLTLALIIYPFSHTKASALWAKASRARVVRPFERLVLDHMTVDDAASRLAQLRASKISDADVCRFPDYDRHSPLSVLATLLIREQVRRHASLLFVRTVLHDESAEDGAPAHVYDAKKEHRQEQERRMCIEAGKSMGGRPAELAALLERIWQAGFVKHEDISQPPSGEQDDECDGEEAEIRTLITALVLYRQLFPSALVPFSGTGRGGISLILSPPPSPSRRNAKLHMALRVALDSEAFDYAGEDAGEMGAALDDARDRVVDLLVEADRVARVRRG